MKQVRAYCVWGLFAFLVHSMFSCETKTTPFNSVEQETERSLNLNFHENVLNTNPLFAANRSEKFIADMVFDRFYNLDGSSDLIDSHIFDSLKDEHVFTLLPNKRFHDGSTVNTKTIKKVFKYLIEYHFERTMVNSLFTSMSGFNSINWYRENRNIMDSIPAGFEVLSEAKFRIKLKKGNNQLINWLKAPEFILFKQKEGSFIGSGPFELTNINEDISAKLVNAAKVERGIETINLSFIKNDNLLISEFLNGSLDLITFNPYFSDSIQTQQMSKIINDKYSIYGTVRNDKSVVCYAQIFNIGDSILRKNILNLFNASEHKLFFLRSGNSTANQFLLDSLVLTGSDDSFTEQIPLINNITKGEKNYFIDTKSTSFIPTNSENVNPTALHIVIKKTTADLVKKNDIKQLTLWLREKVNYEDNTTLLILDSFNEYVIYNNRLKGIEEGKSLSSMVKNMTFLTLKTY